jgi:hypothetical protein
MGGRSRIGAGLVTLGLGLMACGGGSGARPTYAGLVDLAVHGPACCPDGFQSNVLLEATTFSPIS